MHRYELLLLLLHIQHSSSSSSWSFFSAIPIFSMCVFVFSMSVCVIVRAGISNYLSILADFFFGEKTAKEIANGNENGNFHPYITNKLTNGNWIDFRVPIVYCVEWSAIYIYKYCTFTTNIEQHLTIFYWVFFSFSIF